MTREQKLERWAEREIQRNLHNLILDSDQGRVLAFGRWEINPCPGGVEVREDDETLQFSGRRSAISWCVARKFRQHRLGLDILQRDTERRRIMQDMQAQKQLARESQNATYSDMIMTKMQSKSYRLNWIENQLRNLTNQAKYLQLRGFTK
jgi:exonuclease VII large subunit